VTSETPPFVGMLNANVAEGVEALTAKVKGVVVVPLDVVTVTFLVPTVAAGAMVRVAVIDVALKRVAEETVTPVPLTFNVAELSKFVPVNVTGTAVPCAPYAGTMLMSVGAGDELLTVNGIEPVVPLDVVTVTFCAPVGPVAAILNVAVTNVALTTLIEDTVIPAPADIVAPAAKFVPDSETGTALP
jgi:hypothetical protein